MQKILNLVIKKSVYLLVFLLPLFFLPFSFEAFEINKQYLLFFLSSLGFLAWILRIVFVDKEIRFKKSLLDIAVLVFLVVAILSAVLSIDKGATIFGFYGKFSDGIVGLISLVIMYFLITNNTEIKTSKIINLLVCSTGIIVFVSYLSIFGVLSKIGSSVTLPLIMQQRIFNMASGYIEGLAMFLAVITMFLLSSLLIKTDDLKGAKIKKLFYWIIAIAALFLLLVIDFTGAWILILLSSIFFVVFSIQKKIFQENRKKLLIPIFLVILSIIFIPYQPQKAIFGESSPFSNLPKENILPQQFSWQVATKAIFSGAKEGVLGSGPGTFYYDFSQFKPVEFNQTAVWQLRFDKAGNYIAELMAIMGILGLLAYLSIIAIFIFIFWFFIQKDIKKLPLLMIFLALIIGQFVYYQNTVLAFLFWLALAVSVVGWQNMKQGGEKIISFKESSDISLVLTVLVVIVGLGILGTYFFGARVYMADVYYGKSFLSQRIENLEKAANLNPWQSQYRRVLAIAYLDKVLNEAQKPMAERNQEELSSNVQLAINYAKGGETKEGYIKGAIELAPTRAINWETLGLIYREIRTIAVGAQEWGIKAFQEAIKLEPTNPVLYTEIGKLYLEAGDVEGAKAQFSKAKEMKPDYIDASLQEALILETENNLAEAIRIMEGLATNFPANVEVLFQLGRLYFNNGETEKAILQFQRTVLLSPYHSNAHYSLGAAYQKQGMIQQAIAEFEKVLELNPGNQDVEQKLMNLR